MASAANPDAYGNPAWGNQTSEQQGWGSQPPPASGWGPAQGGNQGGNPGWGNQPGYGPAWGGPPFWHHAGMSRPLGIVAMILGFILWWPVGLAFLFYMIWSGRMGCWARRNRAAYQAGNWQDGSQGGNWGAGPFGMFRGWCAPQQQAAPTSGNRAFDEYRAETLRRLEEEQKEFGSFLDRLRFAKDKAEFDQFMAERRQRPPQPPTQPEGSQPQA